VGSFIKFIKNSLLSLLSAASYNNTPPLTLTLGSTNMTLVYNSFDKYSDTIS